MLQKLLQKNIVIIFSKEVIEKINEYITALTTYPISQNRMITKVDNLQNFLFSLGTSIKMPSICRYKDLGQVFTSDEKPIHKNLKRFNYKDESGFQWSFGCLYNYDNDTITIVKMMASNQIKEEIENTIRPILEFWERLKKV